MLAGAVVLLLLALATVRPSLFGVHPHEAESPPAQPPLGVATVPDAVIAIQVDVENRLRPIDVTPIPDEPLPPPAVPPAAAETTVTNSPGGGDDGGLDSLDLAGAPAATRAPATANRVILPRPVEMTWPETSRLKQCIGRHVDVDIRVGEDGTVLEVKPVDRDFPADCLRSALNAAAQIRFLPGSVDGRPATLSTRVRIDFEKRK